MTAPTRRRTPAEEAFGVMFREVLDEGLGPFLEPLRRIRILVSNVPDDAKLGRLVREMFDRDEA